jgi:hypothetical protein
MECESIDDGMNTVDDLGKPDLRGHEWNLYLEIDVFQGENRTSSLRAILFGSKLHILAPM